MSKPIVAMARLHDLASTLGGAAERGAGAGCNGADAFLDQCPGRLNGIEIMRVRRQEAERGSGLLNQFPYWPRFVRPQVVPPRGAPRGERHMARFAPDSSRKTKPRGSIRSIHCRKAWRSAWTLARSCSAG